MCENDKDSLFNDKIIMQTQMKLYTKEINKIALNYTDYKRLQIFDGITTYPHDTKVCESEMFVKKKAIPIKLYYNKI